MNPIRILLISTALVFGCSESKETESLIPVPKNSNVPTSDGEPDGLPKKVEKMVGLPPIEGRPCETIATPTVGEWMSYSDSIFYGTVSNVSVIDDVVFQQHGDGERISIDRCTLEHMGTGVSIVLKDVVNLSGEPAPKTVTIKIGTHLANSWKIFPKRATDGSLKWSDVGKTVGIGLKLGGRFWDMPDGSEAYFSHQNGLFEVTSDNLVVHQHQFCSEMPAAIDGKSLSEFRRQLESTTPSAGEMGKGAAIKSKILATPERTLYQYASSTCVELGWKYHPDPIKVDRTKK